MQILHEFCFNELPQRYLAGISLLCGIPGNFESSPFIHSDTNDDLKCRLEEALKNNCTLHDCIGKAVTSKMKELIFPSLQHR